MTNKHFCQGPLCHTRTTQDRFLKSRGVVRGRYASVDRDQNYNDHYYDNTRGKYFCSTGCEYAWLDYHMESIEQGRPIEFIRHRREVGGYEKVKSENSWSGYYQIERVDNRTELE